MIQRERIADDVYSFQSEIYAKVNAGAVIGPNWAVIIDTLALPDETLEMRDFIEQELSIPVRYVINTHYHADHTWGNCFFPGARIIASEKCRDLLDTIGRESLDELRASDRDYRNIKIVLPHITFNEGSLRLKAGKKTLTIFPLQGHSVDNVAVLIEEDRILFAGDTAMPLPYIVDGDLEQSIESFKRIEKMGLENIVQGHGDIILRGEIENYIKDNIQYLNNIRRVVKKASKRKYPAELLNRSFVEECGKSRILIGGLAQDLHHRNLFALYEQMFGEEPLEPEYDY